MKLSVVTTLFRSASDIDDFHARASAAAGRVTEDYELVYVNDGSPDDSLERVLRIRENDTRVRVVDLSRNFGEHKARLTGIRYARGERIFVIGSDLEVAPEELSRFWQALEADPGSDLVYGTQRKRRGGFSERVLGAAYYRLFNYLAPVPVVPNPCGGYLMTRRFARALARHREDSLFFAGLCAATGFRQVTLPVDKLRRRRGNYGFVKKLNLALGAILSFSEKPMVLLGGLGGGFALLSGGLFTFSIYRYGWVGAPPSLVVVAGVCFLAGILLASAGILGLYLSKILIQVKRRPQTIVRARY